MEAANQCRKNVAVRRMIVVVRAIEVRRHDGDIIRAILPIKELAVLQTADFRQRIRLVRLFQFGGQQAAFLHRLGRHPRIDAG